MAAIFNGYLRLLGRQPLLTKSFTGGILFAIGDSINQSMSPGKSYDVKGAMSFTAFGALLYSPSNHYWFAWMENNVATGLKWSQKQLSQAFSRVLIHSVVFAPFSIVSLFVWSGFLSGESLEGIVDIIKPAAMFQIWFTGSVFWIPTMLTIYRYIPLQLRVLATSTANVFWTAYLSHKKTISLQERGVSLGGSIGIDASLINNKSTERKI